MRKYFIPGEKDEIERLIDQRILNERKRRVMKLRFLDGKTYKEISEDVQVDRTIKQVGNIIRDCIFELGIT